MYKPFSVLIQYLVPQHTLTRLAGRVGESQTPWIKNLLIRYFVTRFKVDMSEALIEDPYAFPTFNSFFTRLLKPELRPVVSGIDEIACPADGCISQIGKINQDSLFQAKGFYFNLTSLLGGSEKHANQFKNGEFATIYLSPKDYHRVHMPFPGKLLETIYIPGKLFSVNSQTASSVPNLFARNERLVCLFDTAIGPMAVILVGAMIVGSMNTVWGTKPMLNIHHTSMPEPIDLSRGEELGHFKMGSTVILLFAKDRISWNNELKANSTVRMGELIAKACLTNEKG